MTDAEHAHWLRYIRQVADLVGLKDWRALLWRDPVEGVVACIGVTPGAREFVVNFGHSFFTRDPAQQRQAIVHELLHAHLQEISERVKETAARFGDNSLMGYLPDLVRHEIEHAVDALAEVMAHWLPLPGRAPEMPS